jgi:indole-3-glycerol phosphate synthase
MNILDRILADKRREIGQRRLSQPPELLRERALSRPVPPAFAPCLGTVPMALIAEVKRKSPSAGPIREPFDPPGIARAYEAAGAHAVSVLMDGPYFGGGEGDFRSVRAAIALPLLYKEFVVDPWQIWHARELGASLVLLIAAALPPAELQSLMSLAAEAGLEVLFEVHDAEELAVARDLGVRLLGINNRNLKTFVTRLETTLELMDGVPAGVRVISESGIRSHADLQRLRAAGVSGVLVGEQLLRQPDVLAAARTLLHG